MVKQTSVKAPMTKDLLMKYTFIVLCILAAISFISFGLDSILISVVAVLVAVVCDYLLSMVMGDKGPLNLWSAAVFGLIVAMSYSYGEAPAMATEVFPILGGPGIDKYLYPALTSAVGLIVFKKIQGLAGRKYVNPAAIAKLLIIGLVLAPSFAFIPSDHMGVDLLNRPVENPWGEGTLEPMSTGIFGTTMIQCYGDPKLDPMNPYIYGSYDDPLPDVIYTMMVQKYHGWIGGVSSIAVIAVGIVLFALLRGYIKWRITVAYFVTTILFSFLAGFIYGGDSIIRLMFHLFTGSSIFLAFFMATDPATTPLTRLGQIIFGVGLALLTMIIQMYTGFLGGSVLALVIMNLTCPILDKVGIPKVRTYRASCGLLPKAKTFAEVRVTECIRCGKCLYVCAGRIPTVLITEAVDKGDWKRVEELGAGYCQQCGTCSFVCPARINLKAIMLSAREKVGAKPLDKPPND
jgi:electron transport complex protein RnfD